MNDFGLASPTQPLLELPANQLLQQFGSGGHVPGSGCAGALMGLLAAQLISTVCKITTNDRADTPDLRFIARELEARFVPKLQEAFQLDAELFDKVIDARRKREATAVEREKRRWRDHSLDLLRDATDLVLDVSQLCLSLVDHSIVAFDQGSKKVRGDSGAAISAAIAGVSTGMFVASLNLRSFRGSQWARTTQTRLTELQNQVTRRQAAAFERVASLQMTAESADQFSLFDLSAADDKSTNT